MYFYIHVLWSRGSSYILLINYCFLLWKCVWFSVGCGSKNLVICMILNEVPTGPLSCAWLIKYGTRNLPVYKIIHALKDFGKLV